MTRWKASVIHFALSLLVLALIAAIVVWRWYPPGLFHMAKADQLLIIIASVDVVIGPLLTLIIYRHGKKGLKFDLVLIALVQVSALVYGLNTLWHSRPVFLVANGNRFNFVFANEIDPADLQRAPAQYRRLPWLGPQTVAAIPPSDSKARADALFSALAGKDIDVMPAYYAPYRNGAAKLLGNSMPAIELASMLPPESSEVMGKAIKHSGLPVNRLRVIPINSTRGFAAMLLDATDGRPVAPVDVDPWPAFEARHAK